jgi:histidine triad (HIT) family protein
MKDCLFCKIISGSIPAQKIAESESAIAIADIQPQAPFHALVLPRRHVASLNDMTEQDRKELLPQMYALADSLALEKGYDKSGYRTVINNQADAGQTVFHLHLHVLAGTKLGHFGS